MSMQERSADRFIAASQSEEPQTHPPARKKREKPREEAVAKSTPIVKSKAQIEKGVPQKNADSLKTKSDNSKEAKACNPTVTKTSTKKGKDQKSK